MEKYKNLIIDFFQCVAIALVISFLLTTFVVEARQIPSGSMLPTIEIGDKIIVDKVFYQLKDFQRGDIVIFRPPPAAKANLDYIKRIIGLPGDLLEVRNQRVFINDKPIKEVYIAEEPIYNFGPLKIPDGSVFVMGDNRNNSVDSHLWGVVPLENIKGKALVRFWPFNRIGTVR